MEHESRTRLITALVLVAVFGAGLLVGFAADSNLGAEPPAVVTQSGGSTGDGEGDAEASEPEPRRTPIYMQVDPNEAQLARIDAIIEEHRTKMTALDEEIRTELRVGFRGIYLETRVAIKGVLSSEQAAEYQQLLDAWDARTAAERENKQDQN